MALSSTTDWSKLRYVMYVLFFVSTLSASTVASELSTSGKQKRQLFREHLLPGQGGKIPDSAFLPERLTLNRLSQNGLYSTDGTLFEQRYPERQQIPRRFFPKTLKVPYYPDNRNVASPGQYHAPRFIDTTYLLQEPVNVVLFPPIHHYNPFPFFPQYSLNVLRQYKYKVNNNYNSLSNEISSQNEFPTKILIEFAPYLHKLHLTD